MRLGKEESSVTYRGAHVKLGDNIGGGEDVEEMERERGANGKMVRVVGRIM